MYDCEDLDPGMRVREILCVHPDRTVLQGIEDVFRQPDTKTSLVHTQEGQPIDLKSVLSRKYDLCFLPSDHPLPGAELSVLLHDLPFNSQVFFLAGPGYGVKTLEGQLSSARAVDFYGFVMTERLNDMQYLNRFKRVAEALLDDCPVRILTFLDYPLVSEHIARRFERRGTDPEVKEAKSAEELFRYVNRKRCDRIYVPESFRDMLQEIKEKSLQDPVVLFFNRSRLFSLDL